METEVNNKKYYKYSDKSIRKQNEKLWNDINSYINNDNLSFKEKFYLFENNIKETPKCGCGNIVNFVDMIRGFREFCSKKCMFNSELMKEKRKITCIKKYGVENPSMLLENKEKVKKSNLEKFGVEYPLQSLDIVNKSKEIFLEKYGVDNPSKIKEIREKAESTNLERYGVKHAAKNEEIKENTKLYFLEKFGVDNPSKIREIREKAEQTNLERYGVKHALQNEGIKRKTFLKYKESNYDRKVRKAFNNIFEKCEERVNDINNRLVEKNGRIYKIKCKLCDKDYELNDQLFRKRKKRNEVICTNCNDKNKSFSLAEKEILEFIKLNYNGKIIENYRDKLEIDIYLPELNLGIEYNGLYWHSEDCKDKDYHYNKHIYFESKEINIFSIWEDDWSNKQDIIKSLIFNKLKININKIYARKTELKTIDDNVLIRDFLNENHIQGFVGSSVKIGLFYNNELVSLMTFGKKRNFTNQISKENEYELLRFCNKKYTSVIGGASKLFNYFLNNFKPKEIISYSDNSYSNGGIYNLLNFKFNNDNINYYWFKNKIKYHRYNFRKDLLVSQGFDSSKTEIEIMHERGYLRIFDSGISKWIYNP
jgi:hypothetical protein